MAMDQMHTDALRELEKVKAERDELKSIAGTQTIVIAEKLQQVQALEAERDALAAHVERLREGLHQALIHWGAHVSDEDGTAYAECEKRCDEEPTTSLTKLKAEWQAEALDELANDAIGTISRRSVRDRSRKLYLQYKEEGEQWPYPQKSNLSCAAQNERQHGII